MIAVGVWDGGCEGWGCGIVWRLSFVFGVCLVWIGCDGWLRWCGYGVRWGVMDGLYIYECPRTGPQFCVVTAAL